MMKIIYLLALVLIFESCASDQSVANAKFNKKASAADTNANDSNTTSASEGMATEEDVSAVGTDISDNETEASQSISTGTNNNTVEGLEKAGTEVDNPQTGESNRSVTEEVTPTANPNQTLDGFPLNAIDLELMGRFASHVVNDINMYAFHPPALELKLAVHFEYRIDDETVNGHLGGEMTIPQLVPTNCYSSMPYGKFNGKGLTGNEDSHRDINKKALDCLDANGFKLIDQYGQFVLARGYLGSPRIQLSLIAVNDIETLTNGSKLYQCQLLKNESSLLTLKYLTIDPECHAKKVTADGLTCVTFGSDCRDKDKIIIAHSEQGVSSILTYNFEQALARSGSKPSHYDSAKKLCITSRFSKIDPFTISPMLSGGAPLSTQADCKKHLNFAFDRISSCQEFTKGGDVFAYWGFDQIGKLSGASTSCQLQ